MDCFCRRSSLDGQKVSKVHPRAGGNGPSHRQFLSNYARKSGLNSKRWPVNYPRKITNLRCRSVLRNIYVSRWINGRPCEHPPIDCQQGRGATGSLIYPLPFPSLANRLAMSTRSSERDGAFDLPSSPMPSLADRLVTSLVRRVRPNCGDAGWYWTLARQHAKTETGAVARNDQNVAQGGRSNMNYRLFWKMCPGLHSPIDWYCARFDWAFDLPSSYVPSLANW